MVTTCSNSYIQTPQDAQMIIYVVELDILPRVTDRLSKTEQEHVCMGDVYMSEEQTAASQMATATLAVYGRTPMESGFMLYIEKYSPPSPTQIVGAHCNPSADNSNSDSMGIISNGEPFVYGTITILEILALCQGCTCIYSITLLPVYGWQH
ncbi:hypothetical protein BDN71DRAFT_1433747 [Pleurotus eryngii]|uniref:Uncharacterized protein n=1 Tax=Pleurotus eryngii TaxID=5323 RepID=A0A9P5ZTZ3_PLEER|nr:hypothetical protein BDN71DRAFT_1433747 [Pleurotus eryngii]